MGSGCVQFQFDYGVNWTVIAPQQQQSYPVLSGPLKYGHPLSSGHYEMSLDNNSKALPPLYPGHCEVSWSMHSPRENGGTSLHQVVLNCC